MTNDNIENILNNPDLIGAIIYKINEYLKVPSPHNVYSYFTTGHCTIYGEILVNVFDGFAKPYADDTNQHVIVNIGKYFYDVRGEISNIEDLSLYNEITKLDLEALPDFGFGNYTKGIDDELIENGIKIGKQILNEALIRYSNPNENIQKK